ncbi:MAG: MFS transporter [Sphingomonadaceae bacterium]
MFAKESASARESPPAAVEILHRYRWVMLGVAFLVQVSNALATSAVAPLAPLFQPELGLSKAEVGLFSSIIFAGAWGVLIVAGSLCDRFGIRRPMSLALVVIGTVMLSMSMAGSFFQAASVMFLAGIGGGLVMPGTTKIIMDWFPPRARATAMGIKQAGVPLAGILTASILPVVALSIGWRSAIAGVGFAIIATGIAVGIFARDAATQQKSASRSAFSRSDYRQVLRNRGLWAVSAISVLYVTTQLALISYIALYLMEFLLVPAIPDEHTRIVAAGGYLALCQAGGVFGRIFWGVVSDRLFHGRRMVVLALVGMLAALMSLAVASIEPGLPLGVLSVVTFVYGATAIGWNGLYHAAMAETAGRRFAATGTGFGMTLNQFGVVGGPPLFGFVVDISGSYRIGWGMLAAFCTLGAILSVYNARQEGQVD